MTKGNSLVEDMARAFWSEAQKIGERENGIRDPRAYDRLGAEERGQLEQCAVAMFAVLKDRLSEDDRELVERAILYRLRDDDGTAYTQGFNNGVRAANVVAGQALADRIISLSAGRD